ncbi:hypothetical protein RJ640_004138 [Escallonia rubra]|uniref:Uncharacterized protein n=1 Tax=Escallonia rubra TaxID=112253 RepID=A0AA88RV70_9ASTE|nr:hypothetical protein RJ640_004138 [Escallonia rubra]
MAPNTSTKYDLEKFDGSNNFSLWRMKMHAILIQQGIVGKKKPILRGDEGDGVACAPNPRWGVGALMAHITPIDTPSILLSEDSAADTYNFSGFPILGGTKIEGFAKCSFIAWKAC